MRIPVLILSGTADEIALPWMPQAIYDRANEPKTLHMFQSVGHNDFLMPGNGTLEQYMQAFIATLRRGRPRIDFAVNAEILRASG